MMKDTLCLIPAKGCSTRLPRKNLLKLGNRTLIEHAIDKAKNVRTFSTICVSTEDVEIRDVSISAGAEVPFIRPEYLSNDPSTIVDVVLHAINFYKHNQHKDFKYVCVLLPTSPFVEIKDINGALTVFEQSHTKALLSVTATEYPPFNSWSISTSKNGDEVLSPCFPDSPYRYTKSTECPLTYRSNGAILILEVASLIENHGYHGLPITPFVMPQERSLDIDTVYEYNLAEFMYQQRIKEKGANL